MEKINIAEMLKDCPTGMELDCAMYEDCKFLDIDTESDGCLIRMTTPCGIKYFDKYGCYTTDDKAKCVIFPKGKTTWEGFQRPFKDGDILVAEKGSIFIYKGPMYYNKLLADFYCGYRIFDEVFIPKLFKDKHFGDISECRFATEKEKQKLFDAIKANGYKWNSETKTLEKLIEPKFKVGDKIKYRGGEIVYRVVHITEDSYILDNLCSISISIEHMYNLVPNKFDITTLKPFESRVLVRYNEDNKWCGSFFSHIDKEHHTHCYKYVTTAGKSYPYCIPYEGNEHLLNKTDDCDNYYKTWE